MLRVGRWLFRSLVDLYFSRDPRDLLVVKLEGRRQLAWAAEHVSRKIALRVFERLETAFLRTQLKPGDVCIDVGANVGYFTHLFASLVGREGRVLAVEPIRRNALLIQLNAAINGTDAVVAVANAAVSDEPEVQLEFALRSDSASSYVGAGTAAQRGNPLGASESQISVPSTTVDQLIALHRLSRVDVVKMDIEGFELRALRGMAGLFGRSEGRPRLMMIELVSEHLACYGAGIADVCQLLGGYGYSPRVLADGALRPFGQADWDLYPNVFFVLA